MQRETEAEFRQLQLKEQEQLDLAQQRQPSDAASFFVVNDQESAGLPVLPSAPQDLEPPAPVSPSAPGTVVPPPSYTSVVYVDQTPTLPSRDTKPERSSLTYVTFNLMR